MHEELAPIIARIPAWSHTEQIQVERTAGLTNANCRVAVNGERFILRVNIHVPRIRPHQADPDD